MNRPAPRVRAVAPGRVNLIGDHTDYLGGPVLPMAIQLTTTVDATRGGDVLDLTTTGFAGAARVQLPVEDPAAVRPDWARYPAGVAAVLGARTGLVGVIDSDIPPGAGLSSSAALEVAVALALGAEGGAPELAALCAEAERRATGVPCGIMDQLTSAAGREGHALLIDCGNGRVDHVPFPEDLTVWVVHSGERRALEDSPYATRRREAEAAAELVGPLPTAQLAAIEQIDDPVLRARARHVRTESTRVHRAAQALAAGDGPAVGRLMAESHRSLRDDAEVSTPGVDALVDAATRRTGVLGVRLTGAGFGGCVVVVARPGADLGGLGTRRWRVRPSSGARVEVD